MGTIQLILAALSLGKSIFDWLKEREGSKKLAAEKFHEMTAVVKAATKDKGTDAITNMFGALGLNKPGVPDDKK